jgi:hypothetical protein
MVRVINPNLSDALNQLKNNIFSELNVNNIGKITAYNPENNTVQVELWQLKQINDEDFTPTLLTGVPLVSLGTATSRISAPNPVGSYCVLLFLDRNIDNFLTTGERYLPANGRMHSYADCVALLTLNSYIDKPVMYDENALTLYNGTQFAKIFNDSMELYAEKIKLYNSQTTLLTLINTLIDTIKGLTTAGTSAAQAIDSASQQALEDLKTQFEGLLE